MKGRCQDSNSYRRDLLEETPVKDKGEKAGVKENFKTTMQV